MSLYDIIKFYIHHNVICNKLVIEVLVTSSQSVCLFSQINMNLPFLLAACPCNPSGGYCDGYGGCYCYPGYTGQYCDEIGREKACRQEGGWDTRVGTVRL